MCPPMNESAYLYEQYKKVVHDNMKQVPYNICKEKLQDDYSDNAIVDIDALF